VFTEPNGRAVLEELVARHTAYRRRTLNLIASENTVSPVVAQALVNDLIGRYADYLGSDLTARRYGGNRHIVTLEQEVSRIARRVLRAEHVELRPLGGHLAGVALLMALCQPGDTVLELGRDGGGHRMAARMASTTFGLTAAPFPFDGRRYCIDIERTVELIRSVRPRLVILGSSSFLFPHPVAALAEAVASIPGTTLAYDASHVMGFLASGRFQDPLGEGAHIVFGSTHKTLPGPQGGIIFCNDIGLLETVAAALHPSLETNHHAFRLPALALALLEMETYGGDYCDRTVANSNALCQALEDAGVECVSVDGEYTRSHTALLSVAPFGTGSEVAQRLEDAGIVCNSTLLPAAWGTEGVRLGTQEVTRLGAGPAFMANVGHLVADVICRRHPAGDSAAAAELAGLLGETQFTFPPKPGCP
jgi:glycine hydroxymethyltransferase